MHIDKNFKYILKNLNYNNICNIKPIVEKIDQDFFKNIKKPENKNYYEKIMVYILIWFEDEIKQINVISKSQLEEYIDKKLNKLEVYITNSLPLYVNNPIKIYPSSIKDENLYSIYQNQKLYLEMHEIIIIDNNYFYVEGLNTFTDYYDLKLIKKGNDLIYDYSGYYTIGNYLCKNNNIIPEINYDNNNTYISESFFNDDSFGESYYSNITQNIVFKNDGWLYHEKDICLLNETYMNVRLLFRNQKFYLLNNFIKLQVFDILFDENKTRIKIIDIKDNEIIFQDYYWVEENSIVNLRLPYQPFYNKYINFDSNGKILSEKIPDNQTIIFDYIIPFIAEEIKTKPIDRFYKGIGSEKKLTDTPVKDTYLIHGEIINLKKLENNITRKNESDLFAKLLYLSTREVNVSYGYNEIMNKYDKIKAKKIGNSVKNTIVFVESNTNLSQQVINLLAKIIVKIIN